MAKEQRNFRTDPLLLKRLRVTAGLTLQQVQKLTGKDKATIRKFFGGEPLQLGSIKELGEMVFEVDNPMELLHPEELAGMGVQTEVPEAGQVLEWRAEEHLTGWLETSNGLQYQTVRLQHRYLPNRKARGKCYQVNHMTGAEQAAAQQNLLRHPEVCERLGEHANIAMNLAVAPVSGQWWVVDQWEAGEWMSERIAQGPFSAYELHHVMTGVARGLLAMHEAKVIRRELSPGSVLLRERDDRPVLTDLELSKLLEGGITVSPSEWPADPYRALEVEGGAAVDERADIYSWGRMFVHAATGKLPERGAENLSRVKHLPAQVAELVIEAVSPAPSKRPSRMHDILPLMEKWIP